MKLVFRRFTASLLQEEREENKIVPLKFGFVKLFSDLRDTFIN